MIVNTPDNREHKIILDGVEFVVYTQRFENGDLYVGGWAIDMKDRTRYTIWSSNDIETNEQTWEELNANG